MDQYPAVHIFHTEYIDEDNWYERLVEETPFSVRDREGVCDLVVQHAWRIVKEKGYHDKGEVNIVVRKNDIVFKYPMAIIERDDEQLDIVFGGTL